MDITALRAYQAEITHHLTQELLPFWTSRMLDLDHGGFITHFDQSGHDVGTDEKSLISQTRCIYTLASAHRAGYGGGSYAELAKKGVDFLLKHLWDETYGGFFWMVDRKGEVKIDEKILYGHSFAIYCLSEYTLATGDAVGLTYAQYTFDLIQKYAVDTFYGGYYEMFDRSWVLKAGDSAGGDRKTLDVHMHLMEAFTTLYEGSGALIHRRKLLEIIQLLHEHMLHPEWGTCIPQFMPNWELAPQIKFDIVWGWDRFSEGGEKTFATDNTSYGHNVEFSWLLSHALRIIQVNPAPYQKVIHKLVDHAEKYGIDREFGGVFVEGSHDGRIYDKEKEFWQQAEVMIGMLEAVILFGEKRFYSAYDNVHRFVFDKMIHHNVGEWWPLMSQEGTPIWTHMSHSWKVNYHTVRAMIQCHQRLQQLIDHHT